MSHQHGIAAFREGRRDLHEIPPGNLKIQDGLNARDMTTADNLDALDELERAIESAGGVKVPLTVRFFDGEPYITDGHRRYYAVMNLIARGVEIATVPCMAEARGTNDADRIADQCTVNNTQKPLSTLELASNVKRLQGFGWDNAKIAARIGKAEGYIPTLLETAGLPEGVKDQVRAGEVSASHARKVVREEGEVNGAEVLKATIAERKAEIAADPSPKKREAKAKATPRRVKATKDKNTLVAPKSMGATWGPVKTEKCVAFLSWANTISCDSLQAMRQRLDPLLTELLTP